jgi:signal transduction histidine kinase
MTLRLEETNLARLIREVVNRYAVQLAAAKCNLRADLDDGTIGMWDPRRIEQILVNLIGNIIKYAAGVPAKITCGRSKDKATLVVEDAGPGISLDKQEKIFERFERAVDRTPVSGLGLGLFIVKQIVQEHSGTVRLESAPGLGSKFVIDLPLQGKSVQPEAGVGRTR